MLKLSEKQQEIVDYLDGPVLVTAGPGSGKTRVLTLRIANIIEKRQGQVLALTFSNKAAEEIFERVKKQLPSEASSRIEVGTIHSFCLDIVTNKGNQIGLPNGLTVIESTVDKLELLKQAFNSIDNIPNEKTLREVLNRIQDYKQKFISPEVVSKHTDDLNFINIYETYNNLLINNRVIDFDDILFYAYRILIERPRVAKNYVRLYKYILIDEAQDLNITQYKIIRALTMDFKNIMIVGDSAQSIYVFNGSDSTIMTEKFVEDYKPVHFTLHENYRSSSKIISAANKIQPSSKSESMYPLEGNLEIREFADEKAESDWITKKITQLLDTGSIWVDHEMELENFAIIGRNRYLFDKMEKSLNEQGLDYSFGGANNNLECESLEMKIFEVGMRVLANPFDDLHYRQVNLYFGRNNKSEDFLNDILNNEEINNEELNTSVIYSVIEAWALLSESTEKFSKALSIIENAVQRSEKLDENFQFLIQSDINLWKDRWSRYCKQSVAGDRDLSYFRNQVSLGKLNANNSKGISLLTVHMSKGLEFDVVFILGLTQGTFPDYRTKTVIQKMEEKNNMFVAITRAKRECYLTYPLIKMMPWGGKKKQNPSEYIQLMEENKRIVE